MAPAQPIECQRSSSATTRSLYETTFGSSKIRAAVSNETPCFRRLMRFFFSSHAKTMRIYRIVAHRTALFEAAAGEGAGRGVVWGWVRTAGRGVCAVRAGGERAADKAGDERDSGRIEGAVGRWSMVNGEAAGSVGLRTDERSGAARSMKPSETWALEHYSIVCGST